MCKEANPGRNHTFTEVFVASFGALWSVLVMGGWTKDYYCTECCRPYHKWKIKKRIHAMPSISGQGDSVYEAIHCVSCSAQVIGRFSILNLIVGIGSFCMTAVCLGFAVSTNDEKMWRMVKVLPWLGGMFIWGYHRQRSKCKPIYDRWVMQHGTDPDEWPDPSESE